MKIEELTIESLVPYEKNAKTHPKKQIDLLAQNIKKFGFTTPVLVDEKNSVIAGHGRLEAMKKLGRDSVPCVRIEGLTEKEVKALRLADNKIAEMGEWDIDLAIEDLKELDDEQFNLTGFDRDIFETAESVYTKKIEAPIYEPGDDIPSISETFDDSKVIEKIKKIEASGLSDDEKRMLTCSAYRLADFRFDRIADLYANSENEELRGFIEELALVIIDFDKAMENGYIQTASQMLDMINED